MLDPNTAANAASNPVSRPILEWIGSGAATCTTISFIPQLIRVWRRKSATDISLAMFLIFNLGLVLWLIYGIGIHSIPIIAANTATLTLALTILALKVKYDRKQ
jgi:MtN3 and saliva related transmembrane protein